MERSYWSDKLATLAFVAYAFLDVWLITIILGWSWSAFAERALIFYMNFLGIPFLWAFPLPWPWWTVYLYILTLFGFIGLVGWSYEEEKKAKKLNAMHGINAMHGTLDLNGRVMP
jgi:hypothetical protein